MDTKWSCGLEQDEEFQELKRWLCSAPFWPIQISDSSSHSRSMLQTTGWEWFWLKPRTDSRSGESRAHPWIRPNRLTASPVGVYDFAEKLSWVWHISEINIVIQRARKVIARALHTRRFDTENCTAAETSGLVDYQRFTSSGHNNNPLVAIDVTQCGNRSDVGWPTPCCLSQEIARLEGILDAFLFPSLVRMPTLLILESFRLEEPPM